MKNNKGFTLVELIGIIIIFSIISILAFTSFTKMLKNSKTEKINEYQEKLIRAATLYVEMHLSDFPILNEVGGTVSISAKQLSNEGYLSSSLDSPDECSVNTAIIKAIKESDYTITYVVGCEKKTVCKRATVLNTETCNPSDNTYCIGAGYKTGDTITFGSLGKEGVLKSGDAFDCDVNGDGNFDAATERFYYVSDYYDSSTKKFNTKYAVLIYNNNTISGSINNSSGSDYEESGKNYIGPVTAIKHLPSKTKWSNVNLLKEERRILNQESGNLAKSKDLPKAFSYEGYSSRFLTVQEVNAACNIKVGSVKTDELKACQYLIENTNFSGKNRTFGYWLEGVNSTTTNKGWRINGHYRFVHSGTVDDCDAYSVRPAIEVSKSEIEY